MGILSWFSRKPAHSAATPAHSDMQSVLQPDAVQLQLGTGRSSGSNQPATQVSVARLEQRRNERNARRELLFQVVRESMVRVGVLTSAFKFKVLSLDQRGRSFLIMIEMSIEFGNEAERLTEIESLIAQSAKMRHDILVQAVYWRFTDLSGAAAAPKAPVIAATAATATAATATATATAPSVTPAPVASRPVTAPAPLAAAPFAASAVASVGIRVHPAQAQEGVSPTAFDTTMPIPRPGSRVPAQAVAPTVPATPGSSEPVADDEVEALRKALSGAAMPAAAATAMAGAAADSSSAAAPVLSKAAAAAAERAAALEAIRNKLLLTGYEDTEMNDPDDPPPALSSTQYGDLH